MGIFPRVEEHDENPDGVEFTWHWAVGACVLAVANAVEVAAQRHALVPPRTAALWAGLAALPWLLDVALYPLQRRYLRFEVFTVCVLAGSLLLLLNPIYNDHTPFFLVILSAEMAARLGTRAGLVVTGASMATMLGIEIRGLFDDSFIWVVGIALGWAGGFIVQSKLRLIQEMHASRRNLADRAVAEERQRIAREIHDVIAHTLSVTMLHLTGARLALERGDRDEAITALRDAEQMGRESLADIRRTVGVLAPDGTGTEAPLPTATDLPDLVGGFRAAGLDVDLAVRGDAASVPPAMGLALYRIAQESLANVVKHAPGSPAQVQMDVAPEGVRLRVSNQRNGAGPRGEGLGLSGMEERTALLGGTLRAGPDAGAWVVEATVPQPDAPRRHRYGCP